MEIAKPELQAVESVVSMVNEEAVVELSELELLAIGGGSGAISLG